MAMVLRRWNGDDAVSEVLGTILMVLLVLIIAGVLITWVMSFTENPPENPLGNDDEEPVSGDGSPAIERGRLDPPGGTGEPDISGGPAMVASTV